MPRDERRRCARWLLALVPIGLPAFAADPQPREFQIPAQPLAMALIDYSEQSRVVFLYETELVENLRGNAVRGRLSSLEALDRLLSGTGLEYEFTAADTIVLRRKASVAPTPRPPARALEVPLAEEIEAVTVTARRRSQRLQEYSGRGVVFNSGALDEARVDGLEDIVNRIPNAYFEERPGSQINVFIRGAGTATNGSATQTDAAVGLYVDGIYSYLQGSRIPLLFYDMERIEVFNGPQGSLYGRNAVGGAVAAYTARPTRELEAYASLQRAEFDWNTAEVRLNLPLGEDLALRVAGYYDDRDSYYTNVDPNRNELGDRSIAGRLRLRYRPTDSVDVMLGYERLDEDKGPQILVPQRFGRRLVSVADTDGFVGRRTDRVLTTFDWAFAPGIELRLIGGYTQIESGGAFDQNNLVFNALGVGFFGSQAEQLVGRQFTHDLLLASSGAGRLEWLVGASYFEDEQEGRVRIRSGFPPALADSTATSASSTETWAAFMDVSYRLWPQVVLDASLRYSNELRRGMRSNAVIISPVTGLPTAAGDFDFRNRYSRLSPAGSLSVFWSDDFMTYVKVSTAYQSGGINSRPQTFARAVFGPSTAISYEAGFKSTWFAKRVTWNASAFRMFQDDYQYQLQNPPFNEFVNLGEARTDGMEIEVVLRLVKWLTVPLTYGYLDARLTHLTAPRAGTVQGQPLFGIPRNTATAGLDIDVPMPRWGADVSFYLRADYAMTRNRFLPAASPIQLDDYEVVDFKTGLRFGDRYDVYVFGENTTDDVHVITPTIGDSRILSPPRSVGIGASIRLR